MINLGRPQGYMHGMSMWRPRLSGGRKLYQSTRYVGRAAGRSSAIAATATAIAAAAAAASKPCAMQGG